MTAELSSLFGEAGDGQSWSTLALPDVASPAISTPSTSSASPNTNLSKGKNGKTRVANLLALTELRKAAWARIYASGLITGDAAITTTRVPTWKQFDSLMIKRHRYIAVDPRIIVHLDGSHASTRYPSPLCIKTMLRKQNRSWKEMAEQEESLSYKSWWRKQNEEEG